jgi:polyribonucleotide nucleotidyltransferase
MERKFSLPEFGYEVTIGKFAGQADGSAWLTQGGTVVLSTVVSASTAEFPGFLPLTIDYREQFASAGKIPGGYLKREGKFSDREVLTARLIDRAIRPLFPDTYFNQLQITSTVYSVDKENMPHGLALLASSLALTISKIPFMGPVGFAEVARINGQWIFNPTHTESLSSDVKIIIAGTEEGICMVEGTSHEIQESEFIDILFKGHEIIKKQVAWQHQIAQQLGIVKEEAPEFFDWTEWKNKSESFFTHERVATLFNADKVARGKAMADLKAAFKENYKAEALEKGVSEVALNYLFEAILEKKMCQNIIDFGKRVDGRDFETVRPIITEVGLLPFNHGSAVFQRGRTQALVSVTLGGGQDAAKIDSLMSPMVESKFMLHYNFPAFSVGEIRPNRGPGRREIGHGFLAASAIKQVLPSEESFPYTIRIVSDILESDGSSSMATVCGSTMALMDAGVPLTKMVSGVAMGLLEKPNGFQVLTDIAGIEDAFGLMDFKVAGTDTGITGIQMDIKYKGGLSRSVFEMALAQAHKGRMHILAEMRKVMTQPKASVSDLVPKIISFKVPTDKIGAIIGKGGAVIKEIIEKTGTTIDIENDGTVKIFGTPGPKMDEAIAWVKTLGGKIDKGALYEGKIRRFAEFGMFVELAPGVDGLVHLSNIPKAYQQNFSRHYSSDQVITVEVLEYEESTGRIRLKIVEK